MYYIMNAAGAADGPYPADWIRAHAHPQTLVSHQQVWVPYAQHPDFAIATPRFYIASENGVVSGPHSLVSVRTQANSNTLVSRGQEWIPYSSHPDFRVVQNAAPRATISIAQRTSYWLLTRAVIYLVGGILIATIIVLYTESLHRQAGLSSGPTETPVHIAGMAVTWLLPFFVVLLTAYGFGLVLGGRARFSEVVYGFARAAATLYVVLTFDFLMYTRWFLEQGILVKLLAIFLQFFLIPTICIYFAYIAIRAFLNSMVFPARWRAWIALLLATATSTLILLIAGGWHT
jgi:hypothetical protein